MMFEVQQSDTKQVAIAILYSDPGNQRAPSTSIERTQPTSPPPVLMQLRDDIPGIVYPGQWGLFGGHLEPGETPQEAIYRELAEEIQYHPPQLQYFGTYPDPGVVRHVFQGALTVGVDQLTLREGWDMAILSVAELQSGACYSAIAKQERPVGRAHLKILNKFWLLHSRP